MKRKTSTEGTLYQLPSGSWRAQISIDGKRWSATRPTRVLARDWLRQVSEQAGRGLDYQATQITLGDWIERWMETKRGHLRASSQRSYSSAIRLYIRPQLGRYKIGDLSRAMVQAWVNNLVDAGVGTRTIQIAHMVLGNALSHAVQIGTVQTNAAHHCLMPKDDSGELVVWTESQVSQFLIAIRGNRNEALYRLALASGMRRGELLGLRWSDIDWQAGRIQVVRQALEPTGGGYAFGEPKTARGKRVVEIGQAMLAQLRVQEKRVHELQHVFYLSWDENDLVFPSQRGCPQRGGNVVRQFRALAGAAGVPVIRFHDLRHTAATIMLSHGIPPVIVAGMLGHTLSVLMTRYAHYIQSMQGEAARLMDEVTTPVELRIK